MKTTKNQITLFLCITAFVLVGSSFAAAHVALSPVMQTRNTDRNQIELSLSFDTYDIKQTDRGTIVSMDDFGRLPEPGAPMLPSKILAVAIPPNAVVTEVTYESVNPTVLSGIYSIAPIVPALPINKESTLTETLQNQYEQTFNQIYQADTPYPTDVVQKIRHAGFRSYNLVDIRITPFQYHPQSQELSFHHDLRIVISYSFPQGNTQQSLLLPSDRMQQRAKEFIVNFHQAQQWFSKQTPQTAGLYDYVIITPRTLVDSIQPLVDWETYKGRNVKVLTLESIQLTMKGPDLSAKIRSIIQQNYPQDQWGIENVLLVGHYDDVPMRRVAPDLGYGQPETDFYYAELTQPDSSSWDIDADQRYAERYDDEIDFYTEVTVGRIPWSDPLVVRAICEKTVAFEQNNDPSYKKNILLLGAFFWDNDPNPRTDNAVLMEAKVDTQWMNDWTATRLYEQGWSTYAMDENLSWQSVKNTWSNGKYAFVNWAGHGSPWSSHVYHTGEAFVSTSTCTHLNDEYPSIIFADACSNSDTDQENIGQCMLRQGGVGFVGATKVALGRPGWSHPLDGSSQSLDYYFTTYVTSGEYTQGEALHLALQEMYSKGLWSDDYYETLEWGSLWGSPSLSMANLGEFPVFEIVDITGGFSLKTTIQNTGTQDAQDIPFSIQVSGGLLGNVDIKQNTTISELAVNDQQTITQPITSIGLGPVTCTISVDTRIKQYTGFILGPIIIIL